MRRQRGKRTTDWILISLLCLVLCGCRKSAKPEGTAADAGSTQAKIYALDDVDKELKEGMVVMGGTHADARAFFNSHPEFQLCKDLESFSVAVVRNKKADPRADDIYVITNYERYGKIGAMEVGPPQFSVNNPASYCK
jgi:hypothetical protein